MRKTKRLNLRALARLPLPSTLFLFFSVSGIFNKLGTFLRRLKSRLQTINPRNMTQLLTQSLLFIRPTHLVLLSLIILVYISTYYIDYGILAWFVKAEIAGIDTSNCLNLPREIWTRIPTCVGVD